MIPIKQLKKNQSTCRKITRPIKLVDPNTRIKAAISFMKQQVRKPAGTSNPL
jgi:hypothetical protein